MAKRAPVKMSTEEVMAYLEEHGSETAKSTLIKHGAVGKKKKEARC
jgi:hypothetical protein